MTDIADDSGSSRLAFAIDRPAIPTLAGERLTLQPLVATHAEALFPLLADSELWRFTDERAPRSVDQLRERYHRLETRRSPDGSQLWVNWAVLTSDRGYVGFVQATVSTDFRDAEIAYVIARRFRALGFGTEAVRVLLAFLANDLAVTSVHATVDNRNLASLRLLQRLDLRVADESDPRNCRLELLLRA